MALPDGDDSYSQCKDAEDGSSDSVAKGGGGDFNGVGVTTDGAPIGRRQRVRGHFVSEAE